MHKRVRVEQHSHRSKKQDGEGIAHGQRLGRRLVADLRLGDGHACQEGPQRYRDPKEQGGTGGDGQGDGEHREDEKLSRTRSCHVRKQPWDRPPADEQQETAQDHELYDAPARDVSIAAPCPGAPYVEAAMAGRVTRIRTVKMSSRTDHPMAM